MQNPKAFLSTSLRSLAGLRPALGNTPVGLLLVAASTLIALTLGELLVRLVGTREAPPPVENGPALRAETYRSPHPGPKKGEFRILALGDSYTWGHGVADGAHVWPALLEERLAGTLGARRIQVLNLGVPGFTTVNELEQLATVGLELEPDLVVVQYLVNDVLPSGLGFRRVGEEWLDRRKVVPLVPARRMHRALVAHSALYRLVDRRFAVLQRRIWPPRTWAELYVEDFAGWRDMKKAIAGIARLTSERGIPAVYMIFPSLFPGPWPDATHPQAPFYAMVESVAREQGLVTLDLLPAFVASGRPFEELLVSPTDSHPNPEAYAIVARTLGDFLIERNFLGPRPAGTLAAPEDKSR